MENRWIWVLLLMVVAILMIWIIFATQMILSGFLAIFKPETYGLMVGEVKWIKIM